MPAHVLHRSGRLLATLLLSAPFAIAQSDPTPIPPAFTLTAQANYGSSVAMTDQVVVVGAPGQSFAGVATGGVTVARWTGTSWDPTSLTVPASVQAGARFGQSVAIDRLGQYIAVGAPANGHAGIALSGSVYVYRWNTSLPTPAWQLDLEGHGVFEAGFFGQSVALSTDYLAIGEPGALFFAGTVNVYQRIAAFNWTNVAFYVGENFLDGFGTAVELSRFGSRTDLLVGAPLNDGAAFDAGRVYLYDDSLGWQFVQSVSGSQAEENFGLSIDARGTSIVVGSPGYDLGGANVGSVSYFFLDGILIPGARMLGKTADERLGSSSAFLQSGLSGGYVAVLGGAPNATASGVGAGAVRAGQTDLVNPTTPVLTSWTAPGVKAGEQHGFSLATTEGVLSTQQRVAVGVPFDSASGADTGSLTLYRMLPPSSATNLGFGLAGTGGVPPALAATGTFEAGAQVAIEFSGARPNSGYILVVGFNRIDAPFFGGTLVPDADVTLTLPTDGSGAAQLEVLLPPGVASYPLYLQVWGADPNGPQGLASSNAVTFSVGP